MEKHLIKKGLVFTVIILFICMSINPSFAVNNVKKPVVPVSNGNTLYVGGIGPGNYTSIQDAIDNATSGDTIFVYDDSSPYYECVLVEKQINLIGENKNTTIINGGNGHPLYIRNTNWVNVSGFTLKNNGQNDGLNIVWSAHDIIQNNIILNCRDGFYMYQASYNTIQNNKIYSNLQRGIFMMYSSNNNIHNNIISLNHGDGITLESSYHNNNNATVSDNIIINNTGNGINIEGSYNKINGNTIINNGNYGVSLLETEYSYTDYNIINENNLLLNDYGIKIRSDSYPPGLSCNNNLIYHNNFIRNAINAYDEDNNIWDNGYGDPFNPQTDGGNYWNNYTGHDFYSGPNQNIPGSDGIGDSPYPISGGSNIDNYPFVRYYYNVENHPPNEPVIDGVILGKIEEEYNFTFKVLEPDFECIYYFIDWGDGTPEDWIGPCMPEEEIIVGHSWINPGSFIIKAKVRDIFYVNSEWSNPLIIEIYQEPPNKPTISGPIKGNIGQYYDYTFFSLDPEGHDIRYYIDWGDDSNSSWLGPYTSGEIVCKHHAWTKKGIYQIKVKAKDIFDAESDWSDPLSVTMPRSRATISSLFLKFLERFPLLEKLLFILG